MDAISLFHQWLNQLDVKTPDLWAANQVRQRLNSLCKTDGGLGKLEDLLIRLAGVQKTVFPRTRKRAVLVFAADHGVVAEGVSNFCTGDTLKMVKGILKGKSAVAVLARRGRVPLYCWDVGVAGEINPVSGALFPLHAAKVAGGTANFALGPAMTTELCAKAILAGAKAVRQLPRKTVLAALGEMGMGNTTAAAALTAAVLNLSSEQVVGGGAGYSNLPHKVKVVNQALKVNSPWGETPFKVLAALGGLEVAALTGACLQGAADGICLVLDGFVTSVAAMIACELNPLVREYLVPSHLSPEPGHRLVLDKLGLSPMMDLDLRVGEGAGGLLIFPLLDQAVALFEQMAAFAELGIRLPH